jgi:3-hydroxyacyl-CoA dehydrogenase
MVELSFLHRMELIAPSACGGYASAEDIDKGMKLGCNHPVGPLALADMIGLNVLLSVMQILHDEFADSNTGRVRS